MRLRPCCKTGHHLICNSGILRRENLQLRQQKCPKNALGGIWSLVGFQLLLGKQSILADYLPIAWEKFSTTTSIKDSIGNILRDKKEILSRWREYFEDLLNPVKATPTDTCDTINFGKEKVFTLIEVVAVT